MISTPSLRGDLAYIISKQGSHYEMTGGKYKFTHVDAGRWEPWNPAITVELKRILNPVPLIARRVGSRSGTRGEIIPAASAGTGFDLEISDWVAPHGKGRRADLIIELEGKTADLAGLYKARLKVSFSNPQDGLILYEAAPYTGSRLRLPHSAPLTGYQLA